MEWSIKNFTEDNYYQRRYFSTEFKLWLYFRVRGFCSQNALLFTGVMFCNILNVVSDVLLMHWG
jgi:hypothetical protein